MVLITNWTFILLKQDRISLLLHIRHLMCFDDWNLVDVQEVSKAIALDIVANLFLLLLREWLLLQQHS